jgi:THO complex subunit 2
LIPHLAAVASTAAAAAAAADAPPAAAAKAATVAAAAAATPLVRAHAAHRASTAVRLRRLGVVSLSSSASTKSDGDPSPAVPATSANASFECDPVVAIFRALLALDGDWDAAAAFLAHACHGPEFAAMANGGDRGDAVVAGMRSVMDSAVIAACALSEGVASDVCSWVEKSIEGINEGTNGSRGGRRGTSLPSSTISVLAKNATLAEMSSVLLDPLSALARSGGIRSNQNLYVKLCRLFARKLTKIHPKSIDGDTLSVLSTFLVPSLSLFPSDTVLPGELWAVLENLPYDLRYKLYSAWRRPGLEKESLRAMSPADVRAGNFSKPLNNIESEIETGIAARYVLKRISKENIIVMGRQLAKTSHNNPLVLFTDILSKIESYDNMILMMVDTFQFVTKLGLDVMGYCLLVSLGGGEEVGQKNRTKSESLVDTLCLASILLVTSSRLNHSVYPR